MAGLVVIVGTGAACAPDSVGGSSSSTGGPVASSSSSGGSGTSLASSAGSTGSSAATGTPTSSSTAGSSDSSSATSDSAPAGWSCAARYYNADDGCDCGCGIGDPDCATGGCATPGCSEAVCEYCYDASGESVGCAGSSSSSGGTSTAPDGWACAARYYGTDDGCDCGCGLMDPDCAGAGCAEAGCFVPACGYCYDAEGTSVGCPSSSSSSSSSGVSVESSSSGAVSASSASSGTAASTASSSASSGPTPSSSAPASTSLDRELVWWAPGPDSPAPASYTIGAGSVVDSVTQLEWQSAVSPTSYTWADAKSYCDTLELNGSSDWRLPTLAELTSLVDYGRSQPAINTAIFPGTPAAQMWTASPKLGGSAAAWVVDFAFGHTGPLGTDVTRQVRCVRAGVMTGPVNRYTVGSDTVTDNVTGLVWQRAVSPQTLSRSQAAGYCEGLVAGGFNAWRLPSVRQLQSLIDPRQTAPAIDRTAFPMNATTIRGTLRSSSLSVAPNIGYDWEVELGDGATDRIDQANGSEVRCVL